MGEVWSTTVPVALVGVWEGAAVVHRPGLDYYEGRRGIVVGQHHDEWAVWLSADGDWPQTVVTALVSSLHLDLTHRMTRLEAQARLATRCGDPGDHALWTGCIDAPAWHLGSSRMTKGWSALDLRLYTLLPALAGLDPTDDTRIPDGTRVVDVRALAIVCQHVFGGAA